MNVAVGFTLQPDAEFLELCADVIAAADYYEVAPETLWRGTSAGGLAPNGFHRAFLELGARSGCPFVAHGVGYSLGASAGEGEAQRRRAWLAQLAEDNSRFAFRWYTDHLGVTAPAGLNLSLPLPLPMTQASAAQVRARLRAMASVVPEVGVENSVAYFVLGDPLLEPAFLRDCLRGAQRHLLLDLHNVHTMAVNHGFAADEYLRGLDLEKVIELHLSGGCDSDPAWLPSGRALRLDAHDSAVPEAVWRLYEAIAPRCPNLRGVTLERMEGTVTQADARLLASELARARALFRRKAA